MLTIDEKHISLLMHEMRSPINILLSVLSHAKENINSISDIKATLEKIENIADYLLTLSNNYLEITKYENINLFSKVQIFNLKELIDYIISVYKFQFSLKKIRFISNVCVCGDINLIGDQISIKQILINLLSNAYKYTPDNGEVEFICNNKILKNNLLEIKFVVKDNGIGMSKEFLEKIFTQFTQETESLKATGTGLGLSIIKQKVFILQGNIRVESEQNIGTKFEVTIPMRMINLDYNFFNKKILIIDDCEITKQVFNSYLVDTNAIVELVDSGFDAINLFVNSPVNYYDLILVDYYLGEINGNELVKMIRNSSREDARTIKIIGISSSNFQKDSTLCLDSGMDEFLVKPIKKNKFLQVIADNLKVLKKSAE